MTRRFDPAWSAPLAFVLLGLAFATPALIKAATRPDCTNNKDYTIWWETGQATRAGIPLYEPRLNGEVKYMYPPPLAVLVFAPLTHLGAAGFVAVLATLTALAWVVSLYAAIVLLTGRWAGHPRWVYILPALAVATYVWDLQFLGQVNLILLALTLTAFLMMRNGKPLVAGSLLGAAVAIKVFPLPAIAYFVARKEWKAVAATVVAVAALAWFVPGIIRGFDSINYDLRAWQAAMVGDQTGETAAGRTSIGFTRRNQSLVSISHRLLRPVEAGDRYGVPMTVNVADVSPGQAQVIGYAACFTLGVILLVATRMKFATSPLAEGLEAAMVCTLVPLCSPLAWTYFFCWLLPAWAAMAYLWNHPALAIPARNMIRGAAVLASVLVASALSEQFDPTLQALGVTAWGSVLLFLTLAFARWLVPNQLTTQSLPLPLRRAA